MSSASIFVAGTELEYFDSQFVKAISELQPSSSVGCCPLVLYGSTVGTALGWDGECFDAQRLKHLRLLVRERWVSLLLGEQVSDPIKIFVKQEPHKLSKLIEEKYRLISGVSLIDTMVDRMLLGPFFRKCVSLAGTLPIWVGWTPVRSGIHCFMAKTRGKRLCVDKSAWDWSVPMWLIDLLETLIIRLHPDSPDWWVVLLSRRFAQLYRHAVFEFQDRVQIKQPFPGIQKSGSYGTILLNSLGQVLVHNLVQLWKDLEQTIIKAIGDDTDQESNSQDEIYIQAWETLGFKVKWEVLDKPEFCGFQISDVYRPCYVDKHAFVLQHLTYDDDKAISLLRSYQLLYYADPEKLRFIRQLARDRDLPEAIVDDMTLRFIVDG